MTRSLWKNIFIDNSLVKAVNKKIIKIYSRRSVIYPQYLNKKVKIYNGNKFIPIKITDNMIGHKFGEFSLTRQIYVFKGKKKGKKK
uniref:Small ribosomal subunit protein uS19m n=1 Tax=Malawimonas jakobiformis TaxID=136089 RepID=Q9G868_MALJA|nr:ribosomal protein S19 [Malawimonas jakobiformis]AAG13709.1 ribosomal protein S19 [Malawimonas jakobiformis]